MNTKSFMLLFCWALSLPLFAQKQLTDSPDEIPEQVQQFQKGHAKHALKVSGSKDKLSRLLQVLPGKYSNQEQADKHEMFFHIYNIVPIWENRSEDTQWFYESIASGLDPDLPFNQRIFAIRADADGKLERSTYTADLLANHPLAHQDPQSLEYIQEEDLRLLGGCELEIKELEKNHFMLRNTPQQCQNPAVDADYVIFEYHFFPEGAATLPLGFDKLDRLVWGEPETFYLFEREQEQTRANASTDK